MVTVVVMVMADAQRNGGTGSSMHMLALSATESGFGAVLAVR